MEPLATTELISDQILFVDEQLSAMAVVYSNDVPGIGDEVQWSHAVYEVVAVRRYYPVEQEPLYAARVTVRLLDRVDPTQ